MDIAEAFQVVIELARQKIADGLYHPRRYDTKTKAVDIIEDFAMNNPTPDRRKKWQDM